MQQNVYYPIIIEKKWTAKMRIGDVVPRGWIIIHIDDNQPDHLFKRMECKHIQDGIFQHRGLDYEYELNLNGMTIEEYNKWWYTVRPERVRNPRDKRKAVMQSNVYYPIRIGTSRTFLRPKRPNYMSIGWRARLTCVIKPDTHACWFPETNEIHVDGFADRISYVLDLGGMTLEEYNNWYVHRNRRPRSSYKPCYICAKEASAVVLFQFIWLSKDLRRLVAKYVWQTRHEKQVWKPLWDKKRKNKK